MTDNNERYAKRHASDPNPGDAGFCRCGLGVDAWVHTDTKHYVEVPFKGRARTEGDKS